MVCGATNSLEAHHVVANTKLNVRIYGQEKIQSIENGRVCCHPHHDKHSLWDKKIRKELERKWKSNSKLNG